MEVVAKNVEEACNFLQEELKSDIINGTMVNKINMILCYKEGLATLDYGEVTLELEILLDRYKTSISIKFY